MELLTKKYGTLIGCRDVEYDAEEAVKSCNFDAENRLETACGALTPQYGPENVRRKYIRAASFFPNGQLRRIALEEQTMVRSPIGEFPAELVTFYEDGAVCRIFPLNGKLSGYWTEQEEAELAAPLHFSFYFGEFAAKIIGIHFYPSGNIQSLTLFPGETAVLQTPAGKLKIRTGFSLYESGALESAEPAEPAPVRTPIGTLHAFDSSAVGVSADRNSLCFDESGNLLRLATATDKIIVQTASARLETIAPVQKADPLDEETAATLPVKAEFHGGAVTLSDGAPHVYPLADSAFTILRVPLVSSCVDCATCASRCF